MRGIRNPRGKGMPPEASRHQREKKFRDRVGSQGQGFGFHGSGLTDLRQKSRLDS